MLPVIHQLKYGSKNIECNLSFAPRKTLGIKVLPDGNVNVIAPINTSLSVVYEKLKTKAGWILKQQVFFYKYKPSSPKRKFINGETHLYLGRQYKLKIVKGKVDDVKIYRGEIIITTKNTSPQYLENVLNEWYRIKANLHFNEMIDTSMERFKKYKIKRPTLYIRQMQKRWGSCTMAGKIILNTELIKAPKASIEYVAIHELCHLVHHNHTKEFYALQNKLSPQWEKWKEKLEQCLN